MATTIASLKQEADHPELIRKIQNAVAFLAPMSVAMPESIFGTDGALQPLPSGFFAVGMTAKEGYTFGAEVEKAEVEALGYAEPVRTDITKVAKSVEFISYETLKRNLQEVLYGVDLSTVKQTAAGVVTFKEAPLPQFSEYRLIVVGADGPADNEWITGRGYPRVKIGEIPEEVWNAEDAVQAKLKFDVMTDATLGTSVIHYRGGTGAVKSKTVLGYAQVI